MGAAGVQRSEVDLSTRVPSFPGVYTGMSIPAIKGEIGVPHLVTTESQFLKKYTPNEKVEIGFDLSHYDALTYLQKANKLWVVRAANNDVLYGGIELRVAGAPTGNTAVSAGISSPLGYTFDATAGDQGCILVHGKNQGTWNNDIYIKLVTYATDPNTVKEPDSFIISVYKTGDLNNPIETHLCSRKIGKKDGHNRNIYVEDILSASEYISAVDNTAIADTIVPKDQATTLQMAQGTNGTAVVDADMIAALASLSNPNDVNLTLIMDGGWATPAYQSQIIAICESRMDCYGLLSTPYTNEVSANYLNDIVAYRRTDLNANSSYACLNTPHMKIYDKFNDRDDFPIPPSGYAAAAISQSASNFEIWFPAAGNKRGVINGATPVRIFTEGELDLIYDAGINPMKFTPGKGTRRWGQKTLLTRPSALDRENVRLLLLVIEPAVGEALEDFTFDLNDDASRSIATALIESYMDNIKARRGVYDYKVVINDENNTAEDIDNLIMNVWLFVKPTLAIEFIKFKTIITKTSISFQLAQESV